MKWVRPFAAVLLTAALSGACSYYNSMYNAKRLFADGEKAQARGEINSARTAYQQSIEKASISVARHPGSRWRDDAHLLMARAHLQLGDPVAAQASLRELLAAHADESSRAAAEILLGAVAGEFEDPAAFAQLDAALENTRADADVRAEGHLARARIHYRAGNWDAAWADTRAALALGPAHVRMPAALLDIRIAMAARDSVRAAQAWDAILRDEQAQHWNDSLRALAQLGAAHFSMAWAQRALAPVEHAPWRAAARDSLLLVRAGFVLNTGDTVAAVSAAERVAARASGAMADEARVLAAQWKLTRSTQLAELARIRADLLPAIANGRARDLVQTLKTIDVLVERARVTGQPLALFAAAEFARDELNAPAVAARLFLTYAELAPNTAWAVKALLAASALQPADAEQLLARVETYAENPYVSALQGRGGDDAYYDAEERLARSLQAVIAEAAQIAMRRESTVNRAVAVIDSLRVAARTDSTRLACGILMDSLALGGIRADSIRAACLRGDRPRIGVLLAADTLLLRESTRAKADSLARARIIRRDTIDKQ